MTDGVSKRGDATGSTRGMTRRVMVTSALASAAVACADAGRPTAPGAAAGARAARNGSGLPVLGRLPFIDYFRPTPVQRELSRTIWGAREVGARDPDNGLEDRAMAQWNYWDGQILKGDDGKFHLFASRWPQAKGHFGWYESVAISATSDTLFGPYRDDGLLWPQDMNGKGHNVGALRLPDGRYAVFFSETRKCGIFVSQSPHGPWDYLGDVTVDQDEYASLGNPGETLPAPGTARKPWRGSNVGIVHRPDGDFMIVQRSGQILLSKSGILGPYKVMGDSIYRNLAGFPQRSLDRLEDPVAWFSGGWYHVVVNHWSNRQAYHIISRDGISGWRFQGLAYEPEADFIRYPDGTVNHWNKLERPAVFMESGHVVAISFSVIDIPKEKQVGNNGHGSKVIVVPFDGEAMDRDLAAIE